MHTISLFLIVAALSVAGQTPPGNTPMSIAQQRRQLDSINRVHGLQPATAPAISSKPAPPLPGQPGSLPKDTTKPGVKPPIPQPPRRPADAPDGATVNPYPLTKFQAPIR